LGRRRGIYGPYAYYGPYGVPGSGRGVSYGRYGVSSGRFAATTNGPGRRAAEQHDELASFQLIELHSVPSQGGAELQDIAWAANSPRVWERSTARAANGFAPLSVVEPRPVKGPPPSQP
jgi:hypothetical protein